MKIGMVGLGRMGGNMALRLGAAGHTVVGFSRHGDASQADQRISPILWAPLRTRTVPNQARRQTGNRPSAASKMGSGHPKVAKKFRNISAE